MSQFYVISKAPQGHELSIPYASFSKAKNQSAHYRAVAILELTESLEPRMHFLGNIADQHLTPEAQMLIGCMGIK